MKKHGILILTAICLTNFLFSQNNEDHFVQSMLTGNVSMALTHFNNIKNRDSLKSDIHYLAAIAYTKNNDLKKALKQLSIAADKGLTNMETHNDGSLDTLKTLRNYNDIANNIKSNRILAKKELKQLHKQLAYNFYSKATSKRVSLEMTPAKHQGNRNTCSVFAATSIAEYLLKEELGGDIDLSESYNYYLAKKKGLSNSFLKQAYESVDGLAGYLALDGYTFGVLKESDWPYEQLNWLQTNNEKCKKNNGIPEVECFTGVPPKKSNPLSKKFKTVFIPFDKIGDYILSEKKPVLVNIWLYKNGINMKTGQLSMPPKGQEMLMGGHVVVLTGYNAETQEYIFKNSWGSSWGNNGFGTMPKVYLEHHFEASKSIPFNLDATNEQKEYLAKVALGSSLIIAN